jgi:hypothetical protein
LLKRYVAFGVVTFVVSAATARALLGLDVVSTIGSGWAGTGCVEEAVKEVVDDAVTDCPAVVSAAA